MKRTFISCALFLFLGCGDRPGVYDQSPGTSSVFGLAGEVVVLDDPAHRAVVLTPLVEQKVDRASVPIGKGVVASALSTDGKRLFVLSTGDVPRTKEKNERPGLTVIEGTNARRVEVESPHSGIVPDPMGRYVAIFSNGAPSSGSVKSATQFLENPNEIVLVDMEDAAGPTVTYRTIRSFGGTPQRVTFSPVLALPGGPRRLLVVETDQDVTLLDLDHLRSTPERPEVTVRLTGGSSAKPAQPAGVVFDDGDKARNDDARIGVRLSNDSNVVVLTLAPAESGAENDFRPGVNLTDVGGIPGDITFLHTEAGIRLAAVVPGTRSAVLVEPDAGLAAKVDLPDAYAKLARITADVGASSDADVVLLYAGNAQSVAFWNLGRAIGVPYRSLEVVPLPGSVVRNVLDIPKPHEAMKIIETNTSFFVLDLLARTASPLVAGSAPRLHVARDGNRVWAFRPSGNDLAQVTFDNLRPLALPLDHPISDVFDVERAGGGRALIALDARGDLGATVLDALLPDTASSHSYVGLLLEGLP